MKEVLFVCELFLQLAASDGSENLTSIARGTVSILSSFGLGRHPALSLVSKKQGCATGTDVLSSKIRGAFSVLDCYFLYTWRLCFDRATKARLANLIDNQVLESVIAFTTYPLASYRYFLFAVMYGF